MRNKGKNVDSVWKKVSIILIVFSVLVCSGFILLFLRENYPARIMRRITVGGGGYKYLPSEREQYIIKGWKKSLEDFEADIVFLGDSITCGGRWSDYFPDQSVCNLSIPGDSIGALLYRAPMVKQLNPKKIFVMIGVNSLDPGYVRENYAGLVKTLEQLNGCEIYLQSILPVRAPSKMDNARINEANRIIESIAKESNCKFVDLRPLFCDNEGRMRKELTKDGIHLTDQGYSVWVDEIKSLVEN